MEKIIETNLRSIFTGKRDVLFIALGVSRENGEHITDGQKNAAMEAAKSVLQIIGADVDANSTALLLQSGEVETVLLEAVVAVSVEGTTVPEES